MAEDEEGTTQPSEADIKAWLTDSRYGWVRLGHDGFGLVEIDRLVGVVYLTGADPAVDEGGEPVVGEPGYYFVDSERPRNTVWIAGVDVDWERARMGAAIEFHHGRQSRGKS
jgi:hypothetical protein